MIFLTVLQHLFSSLVKNSSRVTQNRDVQIFGMCPSHKTVHGARFGGEV